MKKEMFIIYQKYADRQLARIFVGLSKYARKKRMIIRTCTFDSLNMFQGICLTHICLVKLQSCSFIFDVSDGYMDSKSIEIILEKCDFYIKRSSNKDINKTLRGGEKIFPLALNIYTQDKSIKQIDETFINHYGIITGFARFKQIVKYIILGKTFLREPWVFNRGPLLLRMNPTKPRILFLTRLWSTMHPNDKTEMVRKVDDDRISIIRALKKEFGEYFMGGVEKNDIALSLYPDIVIDEKITHFDNYLKIMKKVDICINTEGLSHSIGWKMLEYVSTGKAILTTPLYYDIPYGFKENKNYLVYHSTEECIQLIKALFGDKKRMNKIKRDNYRWYKKYATPLKAIENAFLLINNKS